MSLILNSIYSHVLQQLLLQIGHWFQRHVHVV
jgi:hypothetical protein